MKPVFRLEGFVGEDMDASAAAVAEFLQRHRAKPANIVINSPGGSATEGAAILSEIEAHGRVTVLIRGIAASAASLAAMGAQSIVMHPAATFMIHDPLAGAIGPAETHRHVATVLDGLSATYAAAYARRTGLPVEEIADLMARETWMTAEAALQMGFVDRLEGTSTRTPEIAACDYTVFRNPPERLVALAAANGWAAQPSNGERNGTMLNHETAGATPDQAAQAAIEPKMTAGQVGKLHSLAAKVKIPASEVEKILAKSENFENALDQLQEFWALSSDNVVRPALSNADHAEYMAQRPLAAVGSDWTGGRALARKQADALAALVAPRLGLTHEPTMGREFIAEDAERTKLRMAHNSAMAAGERGLSDREAMRIWMAGTTSTSDYPSIAASSVEAVVARQLEQAPIGLRECVHIIPASDWRGRNHVNVSGTNVMETVGEGGEPKFLTIDESGEALAAPARKAGFFRATEELIRNSGRTMDLELAFARAMIEGASETLRNVIAERIITPGNLADNVGVFDASRGNLAGAAAALSITALSNARTGLQRAVDSQGTRKPVEPGIILVAPEQRTEAEQLVAQIAATQTDQANPFMGQLRVISDPGLPGNSGAHWFVLGDPSRFDGLALILMDDMPSPQIEAQPSWTSFGYEWRAQWPMAVSWVRPSWYRTEIPGGG